MTAENAVTTTTTGVVGTTDTEIVSGLTQGETVLETLSASTGSSTTGRGFGGIGAGEPVPTTRPTTPVTAAATGDARYLGGLDPADPKVAAALNVCKALIPGASARPSGAASTAASTASPTAT